MNSELIVIIAIVLALVLLAGIVFIVRRKRNSISVEATGEDEETAESLSDVEGSAPIVVQADLNWYQRQTMRIAHRSQARMVYNTARGTHHRTLLQGALKRHEQQQKAAEMEVAAVERQLLQLQKQEQGALQAALQKWIATAYLRDVPGIGAKRYEILMRDVFDGRLEDFLHAANNVSGIGDATQAELNKWVRSYQRRLPELMQGDFPDKQPITSAYATKRNSLQNQKKALEEQITTLIQAQAPIKRELAWLNQVKPSAFRKTYNRVDPQVDRYLRGVFAEWEEMPDWFRSVLTSDR